VTRQPTAPLPSLWDDAHAATLNEAEQLLYRSNLLGADKRITNYGGGNTSAKLEARDPLTGEAVRVLWVKGSGGDLGSMGLDGFATLYLEKLERLKGLYRGREHEDEMVGYLPHCTFDLNPRAASIDTPLHAYLPARHVDHVHPDAVIAIAAVETGEALTREIWGGRLGWLPWQRPGYDLGLKLEALARSDPALKGVVLGGHGLFTWAEDAKSCYELTLEVIQRAQDFLDSLNIAEPFGRARVAPLGDAERRERLRHLIPRLRGRLSVQVPKIGHVTDSPEVLDFVGAERLDELAARGTTCPDHFLRTKIRPLVLPADADDAAIDQAVEGYREAYGAYYERCRRPDSPPMRDPYPVVVLVPGLGMLTFAQDKATARIAGEFYTNAINVMRGAEAAGTYVGLSEQEAFDIEYWQLEEAKLRRMPPPKPLAGRVALVTGGGGGIGAAIARRLLDEGACVALLDRDGDALAEAESRLGAGERVAAIRGDVTAEADMEEAVAATLRGLGGLDIVIANAGIASAAPLEATSLELWQENQAVLAQGAFLVCREGFKVMREQGQGGSIVVIGSKNGLAASAGASAYCAAKAAQIHLARCLALEGAAHGIRANVVNPDAVLQGSRIWQGSWRRERAEAYGIAEDELEEYYRRRSLLGRHVVPADIAEAVLFFASSGSSKSTGNMLNVDAGNATAFPR